MKIIPLNCPNCGTRLEIGENKEQLACGTCGSQLFVDRSGGTISLELAKSLGAISTGATQTAAELALVRLKEELNEAEWKVKYLEEILQEGTSILKLSESSLNSYPFKVSDIMSDEELESAGQFVYFNEEYGLTNGNGCLLAIIILAFITTCIFVVRYFLSHENVLGIFVSPLIAFILGLYIYDFFKSKQKKNINETREKIERHRSAVENRRTAKVIQDANSSRIPEANSMISQANEKLPEARSLVAQIEAEIAHNKKIVNLR